MKYTALVAVVAAVVSIPLAAGLALAASPAANSLGLNPQDDNGCGSMHRNGPQYENQENLGDGSMCHDWEHDWDYNYSYNYSYNDRPCMG